MEIGSFAFRGAGQSDLNVNGLNHMYPRTGVKHGPTATFNCVKLREYLSIGFRGYFANIIGKAKPQDFAV